jgi:hypothetical protein
MNVQQMASLAAIALTFVAYVPYLATIHAGTTKPHFFSWLIWSITTSIVFFAQLSAEGGAGAWPTGVSAALTVYVAWLAWIRRTDISITRVDWCFLWASLAAIPAWLFTAAPLWSVVILTLVDVLGFGPTLRKSYRHPEEESLGFYFLFIVRSLLSVVALESLSLTTVLFPLAMALACTVVCVLLWVRRRA